MALKIDHSITPRSLQKAIERMFDLSAEKIASIENSWDATRGTPVFTVKGKYTSRGWTEWTQGFQFGMAFLHFDATGDESMLQLGREKTLKYM
ncbi:MAG: glycosyl hydrolase, partial [Limisphaerales bacterium]